MSSTTRVSRRRVPGLLRRIVVAVVAVMPVSLAVLCVFHHTALSREAEALDRPGQLAKVDGRSIHVYAEGDQDAPTLVFLAGAATIAPVYDLAPLYGALSEEYRTVVVEETGYGYSDIEDDDRDVDSLVAETREALRLAGEEAPYVLVPHSMSGLEALWWAQEYPEEVVAIIGLDMSTPESYAQQSDVSLAVTATAGRAATWLGLHRIPGLYPAMAWDGINEVQQEQQRLLLYRNAGNVAHVRRSSQVLDNAETVGIGATVPVPLLLFSSDGRDLDGRWVAVQQEPAESADAELIRLDCGHAVHQCVPDRIAERMNIFLLDLIE